MKWDKNWQVTYLIKIYKFLVWTVAQWQRICPGYGTLDFTHSTEKNRVDPEAQLSC